MWVCGSLTSSDSHGPSAHLYVFAKYIQSVPYTAHLYVFAKYIQSVPYTGFSPQTRDSSRFHQSVPYTAHLYVFAKYIQSVDGGNLAPLLQRRFFTAPYPLLNIGIENLQKQICSNDGNLAPPQTEQLSMLKRGCGDASSSHRRCLLRRWCKISSIHSPVYGV